MWPFHRSRYNPKSLENLKPFQKKSEPDIAKEAQTELKAVEAASQTARIVNEMNASAFSQYNEMNRAIKEAAAELSSEKSGDDHSTQDLLFSALEVIVPHVAPYIGPYIGPLLEKYANVAAQNTQPMPTAVGQAVTSGPVVVGNTPQDVNGKLKAALALPDKLWSLENVKMILSQNGLGGLSDEDIKKLGQKLSKAK